METPTITLGGADVTLIRPRSPALAAAVVDASSDSELLSAVAALGVCWPGGKDHPWPGRGNPRRLERMRYNAMHFGSMLYDSLTEAGFSYRQIMAAALPAFGVCADMILTEEEVDEAAGFSGADGEDSTGGS